MFVIFDNQCFEHEVIKEELIILKPFFLNFTSSVTVKILKIEVLPLFVPSCLYKTHHPSSSASFRNLPILEQSVFKN